MRILDRMLSASARIRWYLDTMARFRARGWNLPARIVSVRVQRAFGVYVSPKARLAPTVTFPHPTGIVIGDGVVVHDGVKIFQNVTLGGARIGDQQSGRYPEIGAGTVLFAGAVIVGGVRIGRDCVVGANAVVLADIPDNAVAVGVPARCVGQKTPSVTTAVSSQESLS